MDTDSPTWEGCDTLFTRDIDARLAGLLADYAECCPGRRPEETRPPLRLIEAKARALMADGADINATGVDADNPHCRRRLVPAVFREPYYCYEKEEFARFVDLLFQLGFNPELDGGESGATLLMSIARSVLIGNWADSFPETVLHLLKKGCRSDLSIQYDCTDAIETGDLDFHLAERAADMGFDGDYDSFWLLNTARYALREWRARRPIEGIGSFRKAFLSPIEGLIVPPDARVTMMNEECWEIRRACGSGQDASALTPSLGLLFRDHALLYSPQKALFCALPPAGWAKLPLLPEDLRGRMIRRIGEIRFSPSERIRLLFDKGPALFVESRFESSSAGDTWVLTLTRSMLGAAPREHGDYAFDDKKDGEE